MRPLECSGPDNEDPELGKSGGSSASSLHPAAKSPAEKGRGHSLTWWFRLGCFCYSAVGFDMALRLGAIECRCPEYPWRVEAMLLLLQGCLSFLHDAHFAGRSAVAKAADRSCASFLTLCQPLKLAFCKMDVVQLALLVVFWTLGLLCFRVASRAFAGGYMLRYQAFHTLWHILLPLGGFLWIEYTALVLPVPPLQLRNAEHSFGVAGDGALLGLLLWGSAGARPDCGASLLPALW